MDKGQNKKWGLLCCTVTVGVALITTACGKTPRSDRWKNMAPQSQRETGIVVRAKTPTQAQELKLKIEDLMANNEKVQARTINEAQGLYEIFHIEENEILSSLDSVEVSSFKNIYVEKLVPKFETQSVDISKCVVGPTSPKVVAEPTLLNDKISNGLMDIKDGAVSFTGAKSFSKKADKTLELSWFVFGPSGSAFEQSRFEGTNLTFKPDMPGGYTVVLVAQDSEMMCAKGGFEFGVTANTPYMGTAPARPFDPIKDASLFHHLNEVAALTAWQSARGEGVTVAVIDTGVNYNHQDLRANMLVNTREIPNNGIDDDGNSFVDDVMGWDFFAKDNAPFDDNMHGTHVAGISASAVSGVAPKAKVLAIKVLGPLGGGDIASILGGIYYAADRGAQIANMSLGMDSFGMNQAEKLAVLKEFKKAVDYARAKGMILAVAAGNGDPVNGLGFDIDKSPVYPASVTSPNLLAVASVDSAGELTSYSNFGSYGVGVAAPGGTGEKPIQAAFYVPSKAPYVGLSGTSMATPVVAGALAVLKSLRPNATPEQIIKALQDSVAKKTQLNGKVKSGGEIDVTSALQTVKTLIPQP